MSKDIGTHTVARNMAWGEVTTGAADFTSNGRAVARVGDKISYSARIVSGNANFTIEGKKVASVGDRTDHGGVLIEGEPMLSIR